LAYGSCVGVVVVCVVPFLGRAPICLLAPAPGLGPGRMPPRGVGAALTSWRAVHPHV
jgi:hypothetical protein